MTIQEIESIGFVFDKDYSDGFENTLPERKCWGFVYPHKQNPCYLFYLHEVKRVSLSFNSQFTASTASEIVFRSIEVANIEELKWLLDRSSMFNLK